MQVCSARLSCSNITSHCEPYNHCGKTLTESVVLPNKYDLLTGAHCSGIDALPLLLFFKHFTPSTDVDIGTGTDGPLSDMSTHQLPRYLGSVPGGL